MGKIVSVQHYARSCGIRLGEKAVYGNLETNIGNNKWNLMLSGGEMAQPDQ